MFTLDKQATQTGKQIFEGTPLLKVSGTGSSSVFHIHLRQRPLWCALRCGYNNDWLVAMWGQGGGEEGGQKGGSGNRSAQVAGASAAAADVWDWLRLVESSVTNCTWSVLFKTQFCPQVHPRHSCSANDEDQSDHNNPRRKTLKRKVKAQHWRRIFQLGLVNRQHVQSVKCPGGGMWDCWKQPTGYSDKEKLTCSNVQISRLE